MDDRITRICKGLKGLKFFDSSSNSHFSKSERPYWVFCGFQMYQGHKERAEAHEVFCGTNSSLRQISSCGFSNTYGVDTSAYNRLLEYYKKLAKTRFVVSPLGVGLDSYRSWESLYLGAYPIVRTSSLDELYENLPVRKANNFFI